MYINLFSFIYDFKLRFMMRQTSYNLGILMIYLSFIHLDHLAQ